MSIIGNLLNAQRRSSAEESRRLTEALDHAIDTSADATPAEMIKAAEENYRRAVREIADEKNPRPAPPQDHAAAFGDSLDEETPFADADLPPDVQVRNDAHFTLAAEAVNVSSGAGGVDVQGYEDPSDTAEARSIYTEPAGPTGPFGHDHHDNAVAVASRELPETGDDPRDPHHAEWSDSPNGPDTEEIGEREEPGEEPGTQTEIANRPPTPLDIPSPTDPYAGAGGSWGDDDQLDPAPVTRPAPADDTPPIQGSSTPQPSVRATAAPPDFAYPDPEPEPSLAQRVRESVGSTLSGLRGRGGRPKVVWLAAGAAALVLILVVGLFSLSGGRGKAPEPAGVAVAPPPAQTENPEPARTETRLVPELVSAKCLGDSDAVAPFTGEKSRAWVCGRANGLDGAVLNITFKQPVVITEITIVPGFNYVAPDGRDEWERHRLVTGVTWRMGAKTFPQTINPTRTGVTTKFPSVITKEMSMTITASVRPPKGAPSGIGKPGSENSADADETTAISSIVITGYPVDPAS